MNKRKFEEMQLFDSSNIYNSIVYSNYILYYKNELNCDTIKILDNHIIFHSTINNDSINKLLECINDFKNNINFSKFNNIIYLHIVSLGGLLDCVNKFIEFKNNHFKTIEIISIIENNCTDAGFLLSSLCDFRLIKKNVICTMNQVYNNSNYWGIFNQYNNPLEKLEYILNKIKYKVKKEKIDKYLLQNNIWNSKKMLKIGLVDEIIFQ